MSLVMDPICDNCKASFASGDYIYCVDCWEEMQATIKQLEDEIEDLKAQLKERN